jgi:hypothetical protein
MERHEKVSLENEIARKDIADNNYKPFGIYYYHNEEIIDVEWFDSENERDVEYDKYESEVA